MASLTKKVVNGRPYYYLRETARVGGRVKVVRQVYLGRAEDIERRLEETAEPKAVISRSFGAVAAALKLCRELEVSETIDRALGRATRRRRGVSAGQMIMLAAINRACKPRSKRQLGDWHQRTALARLLPAERRALCSQRFWDAMHVISDQVITSAETEIVRRCIDVYGIELRPLIYDTTNFATFIDSANERNTVAQRGHPKGGRRDLRLIGLALCVALDSNIPLCHQTYEGSRNDTTHFPEAIKLIKQRLIDLGLSEAELSELTLVYDKGNNSKDNQPLADELSLGVVGSLSPHHHPELLDIPREQFTALETMPGTLALMLVSLIERHIRHAAIHHHGLPLGAKLAMRLLNEIDEVTLIYPPAGGRQGRPRVRTILAELDDTQRQLHDALQLHALAPSRV